MVEGAVLAVAKRPVLSREASEMMGFEGNLAKWNLIDLQAEHGGKPVIVGVCTIDTTEASTEVPRFKLQYPDGFIDYARVDNFGDWYVMEVQRNE